MALVSYVSVPTDLQLQHRKLVAPVTKTKSSSVRFNGRIISPRKTILTSEKSLLPTISSLWGGLTTLQQNAWHDAGHAVAYGAWNLFVQDTAYRLQHSIAGLATPSTLHSTKVGEILINSPATAFSIVQYHPISYQKLAKVKGSKSQREPVTIAEVLTLPLEVGCSYRTNLTAVGDNPIVRFYAAVVYSYQGRDLVQDVGFDIPLVTDWDSQTENIAALVSFARYYSLNFELSDVQGTLQFDNVLAFHTGTNFARDFRCSNIAAGFSNTNFDLPPSWQPVSEVSGATFGSVYPSDGSL